MSYRDFTGKKTVDLKNGNCVDVSYDKDGRSTYSQQYRCLPSNETTMDPRSVQTKPEDNTRWHVTQTLWLNTKPTDSDYRISTMLPGNPAGWTQIELNKPIWIRYDDTDTFNYKEINEDPLSDYIWKYLPDEKWVLFGKDGSRADNWVRTKDLHSKLDSSQHPCGTENITKHTKCTEQILPPRSKTGGRKQTMRTSNRRGRHRSRRHK